MPGGAPRPDHQGILDLAEDGLVPNKIDKEIEYALWHIKNSQQPGEEGEITSEQRKEVDRSVRARLGGSRGKAAATKVTHLGTALGFVRSGWNAFERWQQAEEDEVILLRIERSKFKAESSIAAIAAANGIHRRTVKVRIANARKRRQKQKDATS